MRREQLHIWIKDEEHRALREFARFNDEPVSRIVRRLIRQYLRTNELPPIGVSPIAPAVEKRR